MSPERASSLADLYGEVILDHNRRPRNFGRLPGASHSAVGYNPLCGDKVAVHLRVEGERIAEIAFEGVGCAISTASASLMTEALRGKSLDEARQLFERFHALLTTGSQSPAGSGGAPGAMGDEPEELEELDDGKPEQGAGGPPRLGKLAAFGGVREFPMRVKCATLAWHALQSALASPLAGDAGPAGGAGLRSAEQG